MILDPKALLAAEVAVYGMHEAGFVMRPLVSAIDMSVAIQAYLDALEHTSEDDDLLAKLREAAAIAPPAQDLWNCTMSAWAAERIERLSYERDVWRHKSHMHQKQAAGLSALIAQEPQP